MTQAQIIAMRKGKSLRARGFDLTKWDRSEHRYRIRCSQCEALVINGVPCHERGCPNEKKEADE
jgi:hypothetical protein